MIIGYLDPWGLSLRFMVQEGFGFTQRLQYPLIKEYSLKYSRIPDMV